MCFCARVHVCVFLKYWILKFSKGSGTRSKTSIHHWQSHYQKQLAVFRPGLCWFQYGAQPGPRTKEMLTDVKGRGVGSGSSMLLQSHLLLLISKLPTHLGIRQGLSSVGEPVTPSTSLRSPSKCGRERGHAHVSLP